MALEHQRIDAALLFGDGTQSYRARDIGRAVLILRATIDQDQATGLHGDIRLGSGLVVDDGTMGLIAHNGIEGNATEEILLRTQGREFLVEGDLRLSSCLHSRLKPAQELHHRHAVARHGTAVARYLGFVLDRLHGGDGRRGKPHHRFLEGTGGEIVASLHTVQQQTALEGMRPQVVGHGSIGLHRHAKVGEVATHRVVEFLLVDKERGTFLLYHQVGDEDRIAIDVGATQIQSPGNVVEG